MRLFSELFSFVAIWLNTYAFIFVYSKTIKNKITFNIINVFLISILSLFTYIFNNYIDESLLRFLLSFIVVVISYILFFKEEKFIILAFKVLLIFIILTLCDATLSIIFLIFSVNQELVVKNITYLRALSTILDSLLIILIFLFPSFVKFINKLIEYMKGDYIYRFLSLVFYAFLVFLIITNMNAYKFNFEFFMLSFLLLSFFLCLCVIVIFQYFKNKHSEEEQKALLELMKEYETILENDKINRHEMLNNLIVLKSYKDKSSLEYEEMLDEIINTYQDHKSKIYSNLYKLPSGFKGIIYYKMLKIKENNIEVTLLSSPEIEESLNNINKKLYFKVCKILGIILDNAIEAASLTNDKHLLIDIYLDEDLEIYVENSFIKSIDLNNINSKGYSTKGNNRGYGLYIANKLVKENNSLELIQNVEGDKFISILKIKNPSNN